MRCLKILSKHDDEFDLILRERYEQLKNDLETCNHDLLLAKLSDSSMFDDLNSQKEYDLSERYRQIIKAEMEGGDLVDWDNDLDAIEAKYRS